MDAETSEIVTTVLVSNLHCGRYVPRSLDTPDTSCDSAFASCVKTIQDGLALLSPPASSVDVSIVTQSVTVQHPRALSLATLKAAIEEAGYDILATPTADHLSQPQLSWSDSFAGLSRLMSPRHRKHLENCAQCRAEQAATPQPSEQKITHEKVMLLAWHLLHSLGTRADNIASHSVCP